MFIPFEEMPKDARIWIYQSDRALSAAEVVAIEDDIARFLEQWSAHGQGLKCSGKLLHGRFLLMSVDENHHGASGCSIDSSVHFIKALGEHLKINWFDRSKIAFIRQEEVFISSQKELKEFISSGRVTNKTLTFNNLVTNIKEFEEGWVVPAQKTWLNRYFK